MSCSGYNSNGLEPPRTGSYPLMAVTKLRDIPSGFPDEGLATILNVICNVEFILAVPANIFCGIEHCRRAISAISGVADTSMISCCVHLAMHPRVILQHLSCSMGKCSPISQSKSYSLHKRDSVCRRPRCQWIHEQNLKELCCQVP